MAFYAKECNSTRSPTFRIPACVIIDYIAESDETGLYYYGHRLYSSTLGRWMSRDPIGERGGLLLYGFVGNEPVGRWDYLGKVYPVPGQDYNSQYMQKLEWEFQNWSEKVEEDLAHCVRCTTLHAHHTAISIIYVLMAIGKDLPGIPEGLPPDVEGQLLASAAPIFAYVGVAVPEVAIFVGGYALFTGISKQYYDKFGDLRDKLSEKYAEEKCWLPLFE